MGAEFPTTPYVCPVCGSEVPWTHAHACGETHLRPHWRARMDTAVLAHRLRGQYDALLHVDTGTALPGVREHVHRLATELRQPLVVYEAGNAFERMVLGDPTHRLRSERQPWGMPGPGFHKLPPREREVSEVHTA